MRSFEFDELERHPAHLMLNQVEVAIYFDLLGKEIKKWEAVLARVKSYSYESNVKRDMKIDEITEKIETLNNMLAEMVEQTSW